jgi:hypothetical protein
VSPVRREPPPVNWIAADILRIEDGLLVEHAGLHQKKTKGTLLILPRDRREGSLLKRIVEPLGLPSLVGER